MPRFANTILVVGVAKGKVCEGSRPDPPAWVRIELAPDSLIRFGALTLARGCPRSIHSRGTFGSEALRHPRSTSEVSSHARRIVDQSNVESLRGEPDCPLVSRLLTQCFAQKRLDVLLQRYVAAPAPSTAVSPRTPKSFSSAGTPTRGTAGGRRRHRRRGWKARSCPRASPR
jgi:hypothetical protein